MSMPSLCVCVVVYNHQGEIATVARRHDSTQWGLPGGKVDPEDGDAEALATNLEAVLRRAAVRELYEETGIEVPMDDLEEIYVGVCKDESGGNDPDSVTFAFEATIAHADLQSREGEPPAKWSQWEEITESGAFADYNKRVCEASVGRW